MTAQTTAGSLRDRVGALVAEAADTATGTPAEKPVRAIADRLAEPLRVAIAGKTKAGKSTLLNALVGEALAPTGAGECTQVVTWYRHGRTYRARLHPRVGPAVEVPLHRSGNGIEVDLGGRPPDDVELVEVEWPAPALAAMTLIDTPGVGSLSGIGTRTTAFLAPDDQRGSPADAVIYLTRHVHRADVRFLEAFHDDAHAPATPVNALAVLSRADEIGAGRLDAVASARRIAERYRVDPTLRRLCQTVVPVAGLLAQAARTMTEAEFRALALLARADADLAGELLLSVDRFAEHPAPSFPLTTPERRHLVERYGLFGLRLADALLRRGRADSARGLAAELIRRSGLAELTALLATRFAARADVLKSRSALLALDDVVRRWPGGDRFRADIERIGAGAHELAELRALVAVRSGAVPLDEAASAEVERLLGTGGSPGVRLGLPSDVPADEVWSALVDAVQRWRARAEHPLAPPSVTEISQVAVRTLEGIAAAVER
jgi:hypothetical protein